VTASSATNTGQYREDFRVVIAGSNGYSKAQAPSLSGFSAPVALAGATDISSKGATALANEYIGAKFSFNRTTQACAL